MRKILKRTLQILLLLMILSVGVLLAYSYSEKLSTNVAYLECELTQTGGSISMQAARAAWENTSYARLRYDWINDNILLNWISDNGTVSENGLEKTIVLRIDTLSYSGYDYTQQRYRSLNRETLLYRKERRETSGSQPDWWAESECKKIDGTKFEGLRQFQENITKARQKI